VQFANYSRTQPSIFGGADWQSVETAAGIKQDLNTQSQRMSSLWVHSRTVCMTDEQPTHEHKFFPWWWWILPAMVLVLMFISCILCCCCLKKRIEKERVQWNAPSSPMEIEDGDAFSPGMPGSRKVPTMRRYPATFKDKKAARSSMDQRVSLSSQTTISPHLGSADTRHQISTQFSNSNASSPSNQVAGDAPEMFINPTHAQTTRCAAEDSSRRHPTEAAHMVSSYNERISYAHKPGRSADRQEAPLRSGPYGEVEGIIPSYQPREAIQKNHDHAIHVERHAMSTPGNHGNAEVCYADSFRGTDSFSENTYMKDLQQASLQSHPHSSEELRTNASKSDRNPVTSTRIYDSESVNSLTNRTTNQCNTANGEENRTTCVKMPTVFTESTSEPRSLQNLWTAPVTLDNPAFAHELRTDMLTNSYRLSTNAAYDPEVSPGRTGNPETVGDTPKGGTKGAAGVCVYSTLDGYQYDPDLGNAAQTASVTSMGAVVVQASTAPLPLKYQNAYRSGAVVPLGRGRWMGPLRENVTSEAKESDLALRPLSTHHSSGIPRSQLSPMRGHGPRMIDRGTNRSVLPMPPGTSSLHATQAAQPWEDGTKETTSSQALFLRNSHLPIAEPGSEEGGERKQSHGFIVKAPAASYGKCN